MSEEVLVQNTESAPPPEAPAAEPPAVQEQQAPAEITLKAPEGSKFEQARIDEIASYAKERGLSQDAAQALLEREDSVLNAYESMQKQALEASRASWVSSIKADPEFGGKNFEQNHEYAKRALAKFGSDKFNELLVQTGYGDNDEVFKFMAKVGKAFSEDTLITGQVKAKPQELSLAERIYGNHKGS